MSGRNLLADLPKPLGAIAPARGRGQSGFSFKGGGAFGKTRRAEVAEINPADQGFLDDFERLELASDEQPKDKKQRHDEREIGRGLTVPVLDLVAVGVAAPAGADELGGPVSHPTTPLPNIFAQAAKEGAVPSPVRLHAAPSALPALSPSELSHSPVAPRSPGSPGAPPVQRAVGRVFSFSAPTGPTAPVISQGDLADLSFFRLSPAAVPATPRSAASATSAKSAKSGEESKPVDTVLTLSGRNHRGPAGATTGLPSASLLLADILRAAPKPLRTPPAGTPDELAEPTADSRGLAPV